MMHCDEMNILFVGGRAREIHNGRMYEGMPLGGSSFTVDSSLLLQFRHTILLQAAGVHFEKIGEAM
jgi:hypothetical protein